MQIFMVLIDWPLLIAMVLSTCKTKSPLLRWLFILLPPLVLLYVLLMFPYHRYTIHFIWFPAILALFVSTFSVVIRLILGVRQTITKSPGTLSIWLGLIRPVLVVAIVGGLIMRDRIAVRAAENYAKELTIEIQQSYDPNSVCSEILSDWKVDENNPAYSKCSTDINRYGLRIPMKYENIKSAGKFNVSVSYFGFAWVDFKGGQQ